MVQCARVTSIFFAENNLGICHFTLSNLKVQCASIYRMSIPGYNILRPLLSQTTLLIVNDMHHEMFSYLPSFSYNRYQLNESALQQEMIDHNMSRITNHMSYIRDKKVYFNVLKAYRYKYNALGMLLYYLFNYADKLQSKIYFDQIQFFHDSLFHHVQYTNEQVQYLEITKQDLHPSLIKGKPNQKQGFSLLSNYQSNIASAGAKSILRQLFLNPTYNQSLLEERLNVLQWMKKWMKDGSKYNKRFRNISPMPVVFKKFGDHTQPQDWRKVLQTLSCMLQLRELMMNNNMPKLISAYVDDPHWQDLYQVHNVIYETYGFDPFVIKQGVNQPLDIARQKYDNISYTLSVIASQQEWSNWDMDIRIVYMNQVGYMLKISPQTPIPQDFDSDQWILQFQNSTGKYYSTDLTQNLDLQIGDIYGFILDQQKKIHFDMENLISQRQDIIIDLYWRICQIQCFWAVSQITYNMCRPKLSSQALIVSNGWNMLLQQDVVGNHAFSFAQKQAPKIKSINIVIKHIIVKKIQCTVITGPNASGKSIYVKQLGMIIYFAHIGFYVPATLAQVPLIDRFICVSRCQTIMNTYRSGFIKQLRALSTITLPNIVSNKTFVLIDQIGLQVDYQNSLKILYTTINYLTNQKTKFYQNKYLTKPKDEFKMPLVFIVTHLLQILHSQVVKQNYKIRFLTMSIQQNGLSSFKIRPGLVATGYGINAAKQILPKRFVKKTKQYYKFVINL